MIFRKLLAVALGRSAPCFFSPTLTEVETL
jgi:hypothetical protein